MSIKEILIEQFNNKTISGKTAKQIFAIFGIVKSKDKDAMRLIFDELEKDYIHGITFSGGDPLHLNNAYDVSELAREIREKYPNKTQWLYTGFTWDQVCDLEIMKTLDVVIDGKFEIEHKNEKIKWRGSPNQNVINVQNSLKTGTIIFHCKDEE